jgi:UDP-N-acetylenolpyruvoylglucosamine reductase
LKDAREAVLGLRRGKGMVLDATDPDTRSAGSFFTNPILDAGQLADLEKRVVDLLELAREVRDGVRAAFGVTLVNEPVFVGVRL